MNYEAAESAIIARLQPLAGPRAGVVPRPESQAAYVRNGEGYRITVSYRESRFRNGDRSNDVARSRTIGGMALQDEFLYFDVIIEARRIRGDAGLYSLIQAVKALLLGYKLPTSGKLYFDPEGVIGPQLDEKNSIWLARLTFISEAAAVEDTEGEVGPLLKRIRAANTTTADDPALTVPRPPDTEPAPPPVPPPPGVVLDESNTTVDDNDDQPIETT